MDAGDAAANLARARRGDGDAFRVLVEHHGKSAFGLAFRLTGNAEDAEEVVQESFLKAYRQLDRFEARSNFGTWLHRIVVNCAMDVLRVRQSRRARDHVSEVDDVARWLPDAGPCPEQLARGAEIERRIESSLDELTPQERAAFTLRHREGCSIEEIGRTLGLQTSAAKHAVFRAVRKLRVTLEPLRAQAVPERSVMHCSEDDLVLHYYDDPEASAQSAAHLDACVMCRDRLHELAASLRTMTLAEAPDPGEDYGRGLWQRLAPRLPERLAERRPSWRASWFGPGRDTTWLAVSWRTLSWRTLSFAAAAAVLLIAGFVIGRVVPGPRPAATQAIDDEASRRVLLMSVTEHLERSDRVLTDVMHASLDGDISTERQWAADLVADNRFFRQDVRDSGERSIAAVLDELERALLDIVHSPADATPAELEEIHQRLDSAALLFKVRVLSGELRRQQLEPRPATAPSAFPSRTI